MDRVVVVATSISGSIQDWGKVARIVPLFEKAGFPDTRLLIADSHQEARDMASKAVRDGGRSVISAGGSGTFASVLEGCIDAGISLDKIRLGFLRKGSADLIGKVLGIPDDVEKAVGVFADALRRGRTMSCDIIRVASEDGCSKPRHLVGFGGVEIFGNVPRYTENRFVKYYKGILGQLFGDLGPFAVGVTIAICGKITGTLFRRRTKWRITIDRQISGEGYYNAFVVVNGDLGPNLPLARSAPLGSGEFYLFALEDKGRANIPLQLFHTWNGSVLLDPDRYGMTAYTISDEMIFTVLDGPRDFAVNVDGLPMVCRDAVTFTLSGSVNLIAGISAGVS